MTQKYAAIGTDGTRPVIWGLGESPEDALVDAREQWSGEGFTGEVDLLTLQIELTEEQEELIELGEVSTEALGIELPAAWLAEHQGK